MRGCVCLVGLLSLCALYSYYVQILQQLPAFVWNWIKDWTDCGKFSGIFVKMFFPPSFLMQD